MLFRHSSFIVLIFLYSYIELSLEAEVAPPNGPSGDPNPLGFKDVNGTRYWIGNDVKRSYDEAMKSCQLYGMELVSIRNKEGHEIVKNLLQGSPAVPYWTSGNRVNNKNTWVWSGGIPIKYFDWSKNQPDNFQNQQYCIKIRFEDRKFDDETCSKEFYYICESIKEVCHCCHKSTI